MLCKAGRQAGRQTPGQPPLRFWRRPAVRSCVRLRQTKQPRVPEKHPTVVDICLFYGCSSCLAGVQGCEWFRALPVWLAVIYCLLSTVYSLQSTVYSLLYTLYYRWWLLGRKHEKYENMGEEKCVPMRGNW